MAAIHCLIFDPIAFQGGSKIATRMALQQVGANQAQFTIVTRHPESWHHSAFNSKHSVEIITLPSCGNLGLATQGLSYWLKHGVYFLWLCWFALRCPRFHLLLASSGPGVDMALHLFARVTRIPLIQLVHGPVGQSRATGYCLSKANKLFYLPSSKPSLLKALSHYYASSFGSDNAQTLAAFTLASRHSQEFVNGLPIEQWPTQCQYHSPCIFWAASLLKWKGLDLLLESLDQLVKRVPSTTHICYIRPQQTHLPTSHAPRSLPHVNWHEDPQDLDAIRSQCNLFVSTSQQEPFGLSILEALAAGMCVIIPEDNAYWDSLLTHELNCLKYAPNDANSLAETLHRAITEPHLAQRLGNQALDIAQHYHAEECYWPIAQSVQQGAAPSHSHQSSYHFL